MRIALAVVAFMYAMTNHKLFFVCYLLSELLDALDGHAARYYKQSTKFGAVLDMVTDRCSTSCLIMILGLFYPEYMAFFLFAVALDITSHYAHLYSALSRGAKSHKDIDLKSQNWLLWVYYTNRTVLGVLCLFNEIFFLGLYLCHFELGPLVANTGLGVWQIVTLVAFPLSMIKQLMNLIQLRQAAMDIAELDLAERPPKRLRRPGTNSK